MSWSVSECVKVRAVADVSELLAVRIRGIIQSRVDEGHDPDEVSRALSALMCMCLVLCDVVEKEF